MNEDILYEDENLIVYDSADSKSDLMGKLANGFYKGKHFFYMYLAIGPFLWIANMILLATLGRTRGFTDLVFGLNIALSVLLIAWTIYSWFGLYKGFKESVYLLYWKFYNDRHYGKTSYIYSMLKVYSDSEKEQKIVIMDSLDGRVAKFLIDDIISRKDSKPMADDDKNFRMVYEIDRVLSDPAKTKRELRFLLENGKVILELVDNY